MLIKNLENTEVISVIFIRDYLKFYFEGEWNSGTLTAYTFPVAVVNGQYFENGTPRYRDILCSFIHREVKSSEIIKDQLIKLIFDDGDRLEVSIRNEECYGQETAMLRVNSEMVVW